MTADVKLLASLLDRWRDTRSPALADLIDGVSARVTATRPAVGGRTEWDQREAWLERSEKQDLTDVGRLLEEMVRGSANDVHYRFRTFLEWPDDPRISAALAVLLDTPPFSGENTKRFWNDVATLLVRIGDTRVLPSVERALAASDKKSKSYLMRWCARCLPKVRDALRGQKAVDPPAEELSALRREAGVTGAPEGGKAQAKSTGEEELLLAIAKNPEDDSARLVYADALQQRGDPRGEFIVLQVERAAGRATPAKKRREAQLLKEHERAWLGFLQPVILKTGVEFERGFLGRCGARVKLEKIAKSMIGRPEWWSVRSIDVRNWEGDLWLELIRHPAMVCLREVTGAGWRIFGERQESALESIEIGRLGFRTEGLRLLLTCRAHPRLRRLAFRDIVPTAEYLKRLRKAPIGKTLEQVNARDFSADF